VADRICEWCKGPIGARARADSKFCCKRCRQAGWRLSEQLATARSDAQPKRLAYADPPYLGCAELYRDQPTYAGEVDHADLIARLCTFDGWALSCSSESLRELLPMCPEGVRVCGWGKPNGVSSSTRGPHNTWEALIVSPARWLRPGFRDWLLAKPARREGTLIGRKPIAFIAWMFRCLGAVPGLDELDDLYPGTGIVGRAWAYASLLQLRDASREYSDDTLRAELERALEPSLLELCDERDASAVAEDLTGRVVNLEERRLARGARAHG
jgi:hypothetical protein